MGEGRLTGDALPSNQRLTVPDAAAHLGITEAAVRGRVKRGTLRSVREDRTVYVLLEGDESSSNRDQPHDDPTDQSELIEELRDRVRALEEANRENRRIIAGLVQRIPELEAAPELPQAPQSAREDSEGTEPQTGSQGPEETARRPWWVRWLGDRSATVAGLSGTVTP